MSLDQLLAVSLVEFPSSHCATLEEAVLCRVELLRLQHQAKLLLELEDDPQVVQQESAEILRAWQPLQRHLGGPCCYPPLHYNPHDSWINRKQQLIALDQTLGAKRALKLIKRCAEKSDYQWLKRFPARKRVYNPKSKWARRKEQLELLHAAVGVAAALQTIDDLWRAGRVSAAVRAEDKAWLVWWGGTPVIEDGALHWEIG